MKTTDGTNGHDKKVEDLRKKRAALDEALAREIANRNKAQAKLLKREFADMGETLCTYASRSPEFHSALKQMVAEAITVADESTRKFLSGRGWL
jgi:hypothetical protein